MQQFLRIILFPFTAIYWLITTLRNHLFDINYSRSFRFEPHVINVGNLSVGGSGKTPTVEYLIRLLKDQYAVVTLSRGYKRKTTGFKLANPKDDYQSIGDEPFQYYSKFGNEISVAVGEDRALAIPSILLEKENTQIILLDDAYQHRTVLPDLNILLTEYRRPFTRDFLLPSGRLRESRKGAKRADIILVTKCPNEMDSARMNQIESEIREYALKETPVFFTRVRYGEPQPVLDHMRPLSGSKVFGFSGLASNTYFEDHLKNNFDLANFQGFPDHYHYNQSDLEGLIRKADSLPLITTEKDRVKLLGKEFSSILSENLIYYVPITHEFVENGTQFDSLIIKSSEPG